MVEEGYAAGVLGLRSVSAHFPTAAVEDIARQPDRAGRRLGEVLAGAGSELRAVVVLYDPLCGADMERFQEGLHEAVGCPILGGGAGQPHGPMVRTRQFAGTRVLERAAVALGIGGRVSIEYGLCHGTRPVGVEMTVTRADGPVLLELDGRPALDVWKEITSAGRPEVAHTAGLALGVRRPGADATEPWLVRAAFGSFEATGGVVLQAAIPTGTRVMLHHRTPDTVLAGTAAMAHRLAMQVAGRRPKVALGFECGARTEPYLGREATLRENVDLQHALPPDVTWFGSLAWGELCPVAGHPSFHNYTFPVLVLCEEGS